MKRKNILLAVTLLLLTALPIQAAEWKTENSVAGFFPVEGTGRQVFSMNPGWLFKLGDVEGAGKTLYDDSRWTRVSLPNGIELLPVEASGGKNYQGPVWYRKHFRLPDSLDGKKLFLHFEAIMGRSEIWINGKKLKEHTGGYLPVILDVTDHLKRDTDNVIAVRADNSDDGTYPPGKPQYQLDFSYFGGIYRDCWLIAHSKTYITDPNYADKTAGGGLFVSYSNVSDRKADIRIDLDVKSEEGHDFKGSAVLKLTNPEGKTVWTKQAALKIRNNESTQLSLTTQLKAPMLWNPEQPHLYRLYITVKDSKGKAIDGYYQRIGIRSIEFCGKDGLYINGKPYGNKLIGANRHQDYPIIGNALSNSLHRRDALKLRSAGMKIVRNAHYPQDPAFMDACDELGLFVISTTPGWQYWNEDPSFAAHVYDDIRQMVRRDRNRPCLFLYEPILNETNYPKEFASKAALTVHEEYPYAYCACACDSHVEGRDNYEVHYRHPLKGEAVQNDKETDSTKTYFTREFGDVVDDWSSHNSPSRAARSWGEIPQLVQACHYASHPFEYASLETLFSSPRGHIGGALWHPWEHQRGYHPDPFYGGMFDAFRQTKYSYYLFASQRDPNEKNSIADNGPMVYIANALTPFSPEDVTVYSNCEEVRLTIRKGGRVYTYKQDTQRVGMPHPIIQFPKAWSYADDALHARRNSKEDDSWLLAEGLIGGKVVATDRRYPARRPTRLVIEADNAGLPLRADGSDIVTLICSVVDENGVVKRLNNERILFSVEGEAELLGNEQNGGNPVSVSWGTAPALLRTTTRAGKIKVYARPVRGGNMAIEGCELLLESVAPERPLLFDEKAVPSDDASPTVVRYVNHHQKKVSDKQEKIDEVSRQQKAFAK